MADIKARLSKSLVLPPGMFMEFGGLYEQQRSSFKGLLGVLFGGLLLVAVILLFEFGDWRAPFLTIVMAVAVLTSVLGSLAITGMTLNISSFVGAIMMVGIVGEKAVFLIHVRQALKSLLRIHRLRCQSGEEIEPALRRSRARSRHDEQAVRSRAFPSRPDRPR
jgi:multidrug efflux pump subunit AcrB